MRGNSPWIFGLAAANRDEGHGPGRRGAIAVRSGGTIERLQRRAMEKDAGAARSGIAKVMRSTVRTSKPGKLL